MAIVAAIAACGGGSSITSVEPATTSTGLESSTSPPATTLTGNDGDSVLLRRDVPPEAVVAHFELSLTGADRREDSMIEVVPRSGPPGTLFVVSLVGFQPESDLEIHLYWADPGGDVVDSESFFLGYGYVTSLPLMTDESGNASLDLITEPSDPVGGYCLFSESPQPDEQECEAFFLLVSPTQ